MSEQTLRPEDLEPIAVSTDNTQRAADQEACDTARTIRGIEPPLFGRLKAANPTVRRGLEPPTKRV